MNSLSHLETTRLLLRPLEISDAPDVLEYQSDPLVVRFVPWPVRDAAMVREALATAQHQTTLERQGDYLSLAIAERSEGRVVGQVNAMYVSEKDQCAEIGFVVSPAFSGRGYAVEASTALISALFDTQRFRRILATMDDRNLASRVVAERLGFRPEAHFLENRFFKGEWINTLVYAMLRREWSPDRAGTTTREGERGAST
jgi:RimJ/RimL family protein N-acetyltransferase